MVKRSENPVITALQGYHKCASQSELGGTVDLWHNPNNKTFYAVVDGIQLWGPFTVAQMKVAMNAFDDILLMDGTYNAISG